MSDSAIAARRPPKSKSAGPLTAARMFLSASTQVRWRFRLLPEFIRFMLKQQTDEFVLPPLQASNAALKLRTKDSRLNN
jgi:hypothetical protein